MARYAVTGCAGFVGSHLVEALLARGDVVVGIDSFTDYYDRATKEVNLEEARRNERFRFVTTDLVQADLDELFRGQDGIFHLAAQPGVRGSWGQSFAIYVRENVVATQRLFEAAAGLGVRVAFASSSSIYGDAEAHPTPEDARPQPISPYGVTKLTCEHLATAYARGFGLHVVGLRYFTVYGPRQRPDMAFTRILRALARGETFELYGSGEQSRDFTYVADAVSATIGALERGQAGVFYNIGGGTEATMLEVIELAERVSGRKLDLVRQDAMTGDVRRTAADTALIRAHVGWEPTTSLADGIRAHFEWARATAPVAA